MKAEKEQRDNGAAGGEWSEMVTSQTVRLFKTSGRVTCCTDLLGWRSFVYTSYSMEEDVDGVKYVHDNDSVRIESGARGLVFAVLPGRVKEEFGGSQWLPVPPGVVLEVAFDGRAVVVTPSVHPLPSVLGSAGAPSSFERVTLQQSLLDLLTAAVRRALSPPAAAAAAPEEAHVLFSGGLDSTILAALCARLGVPKICLWNLSFAGAAAPDRLTSMISYLELAQKFGADRFAYFARDVSSEEHEAKREDITTAIFPNSTLMDYTLGSVVYFAAQMKGRRISHERIRDLVQCYSDEGFDEYDKEQLLVRATATALNKSNEDADDDTNASLAAKCAKCSKCVPKHTCATKSCRNCCKRLGLKDADYRCPAHKVNRVAQNSTSRLLETLLSLWPEVYSSSTEISYGDGSASTTKHIVLSGNGADELFGGYSRYKTSAIDHNNDNKKQTTYILSKWRSSMVQDVERLWQRNFSRDFRCMLKGSNDGSIDFRTPFFTMPVINWVSTIPTEVLWNGLSTRGEAAEQDKAAARRSSLSGAESGHNKVLLRQFCSDVLGLKATARFKKRAMQFGTHAAKSIFAEQDHVSRRSFKGTSTQGW